MSPNLQVEGKRGGRDRPLFFFLLVLSQAVPLFPFLSFPLQEFLWSVGTLISLFHLYRSEDPRVAGPLKGHAWSSGAWFYLGPLAILFRTVRFWGAEAWPNFDESQIVQTALQLGRHWEWKPFYSLGQVPGLMNWCEGILFRVSDCVFLNMWFFPVLVSVATLVPLYAALRKSASPESAFPAVLIMAVSFWPAFTGTFCVQAVLLPFWECGAFAMTAHFLGSGSSEGRIRWALLLGLWTGAGFWTYLAWPVVAVAVVLVVLWGEDRPREWKSKAVFLACFLAATAPYAWFWWSVDGFQHAAGFSILSGWFPVRQRWGVCLDYLNGIFWGFQSDKTLYVPVGGGLLNPLLGGFFWLGLALFWKGASKRFRFLGCSILILFWAPGCLSQNLQFLRLGQLLPLAVWLMAIGFEGMTGMFKDPRKGAFCGLALLLAFGAWDLFRLREAFRADEARAVPFRQAYRILRDLGSQRGPGPVFTGFGVLDTEAQGLETAVYPFDSSRNPSLDPKDPPWAAIVTHLDYQPFLTRRFPKAQWRRLDPGGGQGSAPMILGILSGPEFNAAGEDRDRWLAVQEWFRRLDLAVNDINNDESYGWAQRFILDPPPGIFQDRFLVSSYFERLADFYYNHGFQAHYELQAAAMRSALERGLGAAHLYFQLGCLEMRKHRYAEAREDLRKASEAPLNEMPVAEALDLLRSLESKAGKGGTGH